MRSSDWSSDVCASDLVDCQVRLSGKLTHTVGKKNISVAEIVALRAIHGADAVVDVQPKANDKTPHAAEMDHLRKTYGDKVILALFPGHSPRIPVSLTDVGQIGRAHV